MAIGTTRPFRAGIIAVSLVALIVSAVGLFGESSVANATTVTQLYVSVAGRGTADCSSSANSCTLATARTAVHALTASTLTSNIVVSLADGTYPVGRTMNFSSTDSGNNGFSNVASLPGCSSGVEWRLSTHRMAARRWQPVGLLHNSSDGDDKPTALRQWETRRARQPSW